jgi:hypothetical protein
MTYSRGPGRGYPSANLAKITNRPNCGGNKKAGLHPSIGVPIGILTTSIYSAKGPNCCGLKKICYFNPNGTINPDGNIKWGGVNNRSVQSRRAIYAM